MAQAYFVLEAQDLDDLSHGNPLSRHPHFLVMKKKGMPNKAEEFQRVGSDCGET
ncbi:hypothetical protein QC823_02445 [Halomonas vilamensis]|uniref:Uncharacterized protein n=1 Tax=Vreelandella vilamensis TaxID=531309 RepID=A0ABU1H0N7_9GAMM|nr:hypothetical protein [Halomonas vilamensis]MDR5897856.1 hypothetical protein [Halomonas vilamensis]